jgi:hypothetical protein
MPQWLEIYKMSGYRNMWLNVLDPDEFFQVQILNLLIYCEWPVIYGPDSLSGWVFRYGWILALRFVVVKSE